MPISSKYQVDFLEHGIYHVFNRTNNKERLFRSDDNRRYFLAKYQEYLGQYSKTFCWCLLPNHFHLLLRINSLESIKASLIRKNPNDLTTTERKFLLEKTDLSCLIEVAFKNLFQSYTLAFNKQHNRKGNLFTKPFKRILVDNETQLSQAIIYIHANPVKHSIAKSLENYSWSSYPAILLDAGAGSLTNEVLDWFGGTENFRDAHKKMSWHYYGKDISIEE